MRALRHDAGFILFPFLVIKAKIVLNFYDVTQMEKKHEIFTNLKDVTKTGNGEWGMGNGEWGMGNGK